MNKSLLLIIGACLSIADNAMAVGTAGTYEVKNKLSEPIRFTAYNFTKDHHISSISNTIQSGNSYSFESDYFGNWKGSFTAGGKTYDLNLYEDDTRQIIWALSADSKLIAKIKKGNDSTGIVIRSNAIGSDAVTITDLQ